MGFKRDVSSLIGQKVTVEHKGGPCPPPLGGYMSRKTTAVLKGVRRSDLKLGHGPKGNGQEVLIPIIDIVSVQVRNEDFKP